MDLLGAGQVEPSPNGASRRSAGTTEAGGGGPESEESTGPADQMAEVPTAAPATLPEGAVEDPAADPTAGEPVGIADDPDDSKLGPDPAACVEDRSTSGAAVPGASADLAAGEPAGDDPRNATNEANVPPEATPRRSPGNLAVALAGLALLLGVGPTPVWPPIRAATVRERECLGGCFHRSLTLAARIRQPEAPLRCRNGDPRPFDRPAGDRRIVPKHKAIP
jgi:hypothetical protein